MEGSSKRLLPRKVEAGQIGRYVDCLRVTERKKMSGQDI